MLESTLRSYCLFIHFIVTLIGKLASYLVPLLAAVVAFEVISRYVFGHPTIWTNDVSLYLFCSISGLTGAFAQLKKSHIRVDILYVKVSPNMRSIFDLIAYTLIIIFLFIVLTSCWERLVEAFQNSYKRPSEWAPAVYPFWFICVASSVLMLAQYSTDFICSLFRLFTGRKLLAPKKYFAGEQTHEH